MADSGKTVAASSPGQPAGRGAADFIRIEHVSKRFGTSLAVDDLSLSIRQGEVFALLGSSGCGKSTLLRLVAGLEAPDAGRILVDGADITALPPYRRPVNMMFQSYALFPHMTVEGNAAYGLKREGLPRAEIRERVKAALELVQMTALANRKPHELSGGQQQRVALARSLVKRPKLLLLDEPMSALDKKIRQETQFELGNILYAVGVTCILVTHDQEEAMTMADRIALMRNGRIEQLGTPEQVYESPGSAFVAQFIGSTNLFEIEVLDRDAGLYRTRDLELPLAIRADRLPAPGRVIRASLRPERIALSHDPLALPTNSARGILEQIAYMGSYTLFYVRLPAGKLMVIDMSRRAVRSLGRVPDYGDTVQLTWDPDALVLVDP